MLNISLIKPNNVTFKSLPPLNYKKVDEYLSRSAQPNEENFLWLKEQGVSNIINFRTMFVPAVDFDEAKVLKKLGMVYHNIPLNESNLNQRQGVDEKLLLFFKIIEKVREAGQKIHIHCKAGADRTGFFALLYKSKYDIDTFQQNADEMLNLGHNKILYPNVIDYAKILASRLKN